MHGIGSAIYMLVGGLLVAPAIGSGGAALELAAKQINKESYAIPRSILETATKVIQATTAVFALWVFAVNSHIFLGGGILFVGIVMVLTHILNGIAENTNNEKLKNILNVADKVSSCTSKAINIAILTWAISSFNRPILATMTCIVSGAVSLATLLKKDPVQVKQP